MSDNPCNCETCTVSGCNWNKAKWGTTWHTDVYYFINKHGCMSHQDTREYLMADVLKELETRDAAMNDCRAKRLVSLPEVITLIKNGVEQ